MQKLTGSQKGWTAIVIAAWVIALAALVFVLPRTTAGSATPLSQASASGSLVATLDEMEPSPADAVAGQMIDLRYVYGEDVEAFVPLCKEEPQELIDAKLEQAEAVADDIDLASGNNYMLLITDPEEGVTQIDPVPADAVDLCNGNYFDQFFSTDQGFPVYWDGMWRFGIRVQ